jgi:hypothetical protein
MSDIYAMRRANGDWFALDDNGRFRVPLFHSSRDAMIARSRNFEMLLFKPVKLDARLLQEMMPEEGGGNVDFCLVNDPLMNLNRGDLMEHAHLAQLLNALTEPPRVRGKGNGFHMPVPDTLIKVPVV